MASESSTLTIRVSSKLKKRIEKIARQSRRSKSDVGKEALESYADWNEEMLARIDEGIAQAERGEFATDEEVVATFERIKSKLRAR